MSTLDHNYLTVWKAIDYLVKIVSNQLVQFVLYFKEALSLLQGCSLSQLCCFVSGRISYNLALHLTTGWCWFFCLWTKQKCSTNNSCLLQDQQSFMHLHNSPTDCWPFARDNYLHKGIPLAGYHLPQSPAISNYNDHGHGHKAQVKDSPILHQSMIWKAERIILKWTYNSTFVVKQCTNNLYYSTILEEQNL